VLGKEMEQFAKRGAKVERAAGAGAGGCERQEQKAMRGAGTEDKESSRTRRL
jgi:hypothetical protein